MTGPEPPIHCLRPEFTYSLADRLLCGESINLISPHGQGRRRTLEDLHQALPASMLIIQINMIFYCNDYKGLVKAIASNFNKPGECPETLEELFEMLEQKQRNVLLILHNFDELWCDGTPAPCFNCGFFEELNRIRNRMNVALLCVSETDSRQWQLPCPTNLLSLALPPISRTQLIEEIRQRQLPIESTDHESLADWLLAQEKPYTLMDEVDTAWFSKRSWLD